MPEFQTPSSVTRAYLARESGAAYQVSIWVPYGQAPEGGWPVVYVLDANAMFGSFVEAIQRSGRRPDATGIGMAAVVGIAHGGERLFATEHRYRDYTFESSPLVESAQAGGGAAFLSFIVDQLAPELSLEFSLNTERQSLFGHSLAGYFVLNALATRPAAFCHYAAISPSVWWQPAALAARINDLQQNDTAHIRGVLVAVGEWEGQPAPWLAGSDGLGTGGLGIGALATLMQRRGERQMIEQASAMADILSPVLCGRLTYRCFPEEDHSSIVMIAIQRTLRLIFS